jgi:RNA polymerase sigma-70 factor (ECF subfamily)
MGTGGREDETPLDEAEFRALVERLRGGDEEAARGVYERWAVPLLRLTRARLRGVLAAREDAEDVVQSVYRSFFRRFDRGEYQVGQWHDVWSLLSTIAIRKCSNRQRYHGAACRAPARELALELAEPRATDPAPEQAAMLAETVERLLLRFPPPERAIVELSLQGFTVKEIGVRLGLAESSIYHIREHVRQWLVRQTGDR